VFHVAFLRLSTFVNIGMAIHLKAMVFFGQIQIFWQPWDKKADEDLFSRGTKNKGLSLHSAIKFKLSMDCS